MSAEIMIVDDEAAIADLVDVYLKMKDTQSTNFILPHRRWNVWSRSGWIWPFWM